MYIWDTFGTMREKYCKTLHFNFVDFPVNFIKQFFPVSFGASNKCYYRNSSRIIVYIKPTKNIAYHNTEELIFYAENHDGQFQKFACI